MMIEKINRLLNVVLAENEVNYHEPKGIVASKALASKA